MKLTFEKVDPGVTRAWTGKGHDSLEQLLKDLESGLEQVRANGLQNIGLLVEDHPERMPPTTGFNLSGDLDGLSYWWEYYIEFQKLTPEGKSRVRQFKQRAAIARSLLSQGLAGEQA